MHGLEVCSGELLESGVPSHEMRGDHQGRKEGKRLSLGILQCLEVTEGPAEEA